jgi:Prokaryotic lipoprotein-attachment site
LARTGLSRRWRAGFVLALLGVAAVSLAACGRNGPPELPPGPMFDSSYSPPGAARAMAVQGAAPAPAAAPAPPGSPENLRERQYENTAQNGFDKSGNPVAGQSQNKSFFLDFLLQ